MLKAALKGMFADFLYQSIWMDLVEQHWSCEIVFIAHFMELVE